MQSRSLFLASLVCALLAASALILLAPAPAPSSAGVVVPALSLRPDTPGTLTITPVPPGAEIWPDFSSGPSATTPATLTLSPITHPVLLRLAGYREYGTSVAVRPGGNLTLAVAMEPER